jgi:hypothetical protein
MRRSLRAHRVRLRKNTRGRALIVANVAVRRTGSQCHFVHDALNIRQSS